ncbi:MAG: hypothetical protein U9Q90_04265 [Campylobacterota bacterium]|nr:hypothetical protein [Campylobacterota bacterium]
MSASSQDDTAKRCYNHSMKNARSILSHLTHQPQFRSLRKQSCYRKFIHLLPPKFQQAIAFVYIDKATLFIALSHPGYKMELNYNRDLLKSVLTMMGEHDPECSEMKAEKVVIFNSKYHSSVPKEHPSTDPKYTELAKADFTVQTDDVTLREKFEIIKKRILANREID